MNEATVSNFVKLTPHCCEEMHNSFLLPFTGYFVFFSYCSAGIDISLDDCLAIDCHRIAVKMLSLAWIIPIKNLRLLNSFEV